MSISLFRQKRHIIFSFKWNDHGSYSRVWIWNQCLLKAR